MPQKFKTGVVVEELGSASTQAVGVKVDGDSETRIKIDAGGKLTWGSGAATGDVTLYRSAANALKTDDTLQAAAGVITVTTDGAPSAALADGAIAIDTTNDAFYFRSSSTWSQVSGGGGASLSVSDGPPDSPSAGDLWFESDTGRTLVYYADGSSNQWVEIGLASASGASGADGKIQFSESDSLTSDTLLHWDNTNNRLGVGTASPDRTLHVAGTFRAVGDHDDNVLLESTGTGLGIIASHTGSGTPVPWDIREDSSTDHNSASYAPLWITRMNVTADGAGSNLQFRVKKNDGTAQEVGGLGATIDTGLTASATVTGSLHFYTTDAGTYRTEQMTIKSDGKVGIGTTSPTQKLTVVGSGLPTLSVQSGSNDVAYGVTFEDNGGEQHGYVGCNGNDDMSIRGVSVNSLLFFMVGGTWRNYMTTDGDIRPYDQNGALDIGTSSYRYGQGHFVDVFTHDGLIHTSDVNLKTDIVDTPLGLDFIKGLRPVQYRWNGGTRSHQGFISQEVETVLDSIDGTTASDQGMWCVKEIDNDRIELVDQDDGSVEKVIHENPTTFEQSLRYNELMAPMVKALQEIVTRLEALESA